MTEECCLTVAQRCYSEREPERTDSFEGQDAARSDEFFTLLLPSYPEMRLALPAPGAVARRLECVKPRAIHIATEGPLGHALRRIGTRPVFSQA